MGGGKNNEKEEEEREAKRKNCRKWDIGKDMFKYANTIMSVRLIYSPVSTHNHVIISLY